VLTRKTLLMQLEPGVLVRDQHHQQLFDMTHHLPLQKTLSIGLDTALLVGVMEQTHLQQVPDTQLPVWLRLQLA
jgi:hypothetical protein